MLTASRPSQRDLGDVLDDHAAGAHSRGFAAQLHRNANLDDLVFGNPREIDVDDMGAPSVPLDLANEGRFVDRAGQADQTTAVSNRGRQGLGRYGQRNAFQSVSV